MHVDPGVVVRPSDMPAMIDLRQQSSTRYKSATSDGGLTADPTGCNVVAAVSRYHKLVWCRRWES